MIGCRYSPSIFLTLVLFELRTYCLIPFAPETPLLRRNSLTELLFFPAVTTKLLLQLV